MSSSPFTSQGVVDSQSEFTQSLNARPWRRWWIVALLKCMQHHVVLKPPDSPIWSPEALLFLHDLRANISRALRQVTFPDVYDEWVHQLHENGIVHPIWTPDNCQFVRNMLSTDVVTVRILEEILSFRRQDLFFTYELLGLTHVNIDEVFDWQRLKLGHNWTDEVDSDDSSSCKDLELDP